MYNADNIFKSFDIIDKCNNEIDIVKTIFFICSCNLDILPFVIRQLLSSLEGLQFGEINMMKASGVMLVEGEAIVEKIEEEIVNYDLSKNLSLLKCWSMPTYYRTVQNPEVDEMISVLDERIAGEIIEWAKQERNPFILYHDLKSLTVGGKLCKTEDFRQLHGQLEALGASQIFFVHKESEIEKIVPRPDMVFQIAKVNDGNQTIRVSLISATARLQDTILPVELTLDYRDDGTWSVVTSMSREGQDAAIKALALLKKTRKEIANTIGNISPSTVGRRLITMAKNNEIIIDGHNVLPYK